MVPRIFSRGNVFSSAFKYHPCQQTGKLQLFSTLDGHYRELINAKKRCESKLPMVPQHILNCLVQWLSFNVSLLAITNSAKSKYFYALKENSCSCLCRIDQNIRMPYANHHVSTISCCLFATLALIVVCSIYAGQLFWAPKKIKRKAKMPLNLCIIFSVKGFFPHYCQVSVLADYSVIVRNHKLLSHKCCLGFPELSF